MHEQDVMFFQQCGVYSDGTDGYSDGEEGSEVEEEQGTEDAWGPAGVGITRAAEAAAGDNYSDGGGDDPCGDAGDDMELDPEQLPGVSSA
jgi:hypothetical protein